MIHSPCLTSSNLSDDCLKGVFFFLAVPRGLWDRSSRPGIELSPSAVKARSTNHWTAREVPASNTFETSSLTY